MAGDKQAKTFLGEKSSKMRKKNSLCIKQQINIFRITCLSSFALFDIACPAV